MSSPFEFHDAKTMRLKEGAELLPDMLDKVLKQFSAQVPLNFRRGQATSVGAVCPAGPNEYYAVVLIGPCQNLETIHEALVASAQVAVPNARKIGIE